MTIRQDGDILCIGEFESLGAADAPAFQSAVSAALSDTVNRLDIDLTGTQYLDCAGVGALVALRRQALGHNARLVVRLLHPDRRLDRVLALSGTGHLFGLAPRPEPPPVQLVSPEICSALSA